MLFLSARGVFLRGTGISTLCSLMPLRGPADNTGLERNAPAHGVKTPGNPAGPRHHAADPARHRDAGAGADRRHGCLRAGLRAPDNAGHGLDRENSACGKFPLLRRRRPDHDAAPRPNAGRQQYPAFHLPDGIASVRAPRQKPQQRVSPGAFLAAQHGRGVRGQSAGDPGTRPAGRRSLYRGPGTRQSANWLYACFCRRKPTACTR